MKNLIISSICLLFLLSAIPIVLAAREHITDAGVNSLGLIWAEGETKGTCWLGCTVTYDGEEHDKDPERVRGRFSENFPGTMWNAFDWTVALWEKRVEKEDCNKGPRGGPCKWCEKNGYHLEGEIDRKSGHFSGSGSKW